jgi:hypothetical protein
MALNQARGIAREVELSKLTVLIGQLLRQLADCAQTAVTRSSSVVGWTFSFLPRLADERHDLRNLVPVVQEQPLTKLLENSASAGLGATFECWGASLFGEMQIGRNVTGQSTSTGKGV